ncbi:hypothetical protein [Arthrobacter pityocampae]|uniref:hypothetical protein n=1 Tax=Arthrobacter pityocampae TaxID=547334 RepID=UPI003736D16B
MKDTSSNTHTATAKFRQEGVHEQQSHEGATDATLIAAILDAQTEATLALAFEQRTANLIAMWRDGAVDPGAPGINYGALLGQIKERLDLA